MKGGIVTKWGETFRTFLFFFFLSFHFSKRLKFVSGKVTLPPQKNFPVTPLQPAGLVSVKSYWPKVRVTCLGPKGGFYVQPWMKLHLGSKSEM